MQLNLSMFREFVKFFIKNDVDYNELKDDKISFLDIGTVRVKTPTEEFTFPLSITDKEDGVSNASIVKLVDGRIYIVLKKDYFYLVMEHDFFPVMWGTVSHEIGHYLAGHFSGRKINEFLDVREEIQRFFSCRFEETKSSKDEQSYMRSVAASLLKGGVFNMELEADLIALRFCSLSDLVHTHTMDLDNKKNVFTVMEKLNRINKLNKLVKDATIDKKGYEMTIDFHREGF